MSRMSFRRCYQKLNNSELIPSLCEDEGEEERNISSYSRFVNEASGVYETQSEVEQCSSFGGSRNEKMKKDLRKENDGSKKAAKCPSSAVKENDNVANISKRPNSVALVMDDTGNAGDGYQSMTTPHDKNVSNGYHGNKARSGGNGSNKTSNIDVSNTTKSGDQVKSDRTSRRSSSTRRRNALVIR